MVWVTWTGWLQSVRGCGDLVRSCAGQTLRREALELLTVTGRSLAPVSSGGAPNTPDVRETELRRTTVVNLRERAKAEGVEGTSQMRQEELVQALAGAVADLPTETWRGRGRPTDPRETPV